MTFEGLVVEEYVRAHPPVGALLDERDESYRRPWRVWCGVPCTTEGNAECDAHVRVVR
jgi:hypothetical protein